MIVRYFDYSKQNMDVLEKYKEQIDILSGLKSDYEMECYVSELEKRFAQYCGVKYAIGTNSGTSALQLSLFTTGIKKYDEVILPTNTYVATALAISNLGAKPVFADVCQYDYNIDTSKIEEKITSKTKAIIPVHMYGQIADMKPIIEIAERHRICVIEDASHSHGAEYYGKKAGSIGDIGCFSLHASKIIGVLGNAGMITTNKKELFEKIKSVINADNNTEFIRLLGRTPWSLDPVHAAMLKVKLPILEFWLKCRRENANLYNELINSPSIFKPTENKYTKHVYRDYVIRTKRREKLRLFLKENGIETRIHYPLPLHLTKTYSYLGYKKGDFPMSEKTTNEILSLPNFIGMRKSEIYHVAGKVNNFK